MAVDGITAAGKSTFATDLVSTIRNRREPAIHLSTDDFHHLRAHRHRQGRESAIGYYQDAYDLDAFARLVLRPLGPGGDGRFRPRWHDLASDQLLECEPERAPASAVVVVDGSFLQRSELGGLWDQVIFLDTSFAAARAQGSVRDAGLFGDRAAAEVAYDRRYHAACKLYLEQVDPRSRADIVVSHDDPASPVVRRLVAG